MGDDAAAGGGESPVGSVVEGEGEGVDSVLGEAEEAAVVVDRRVDVWIEVEPWELAREIGSGSGGGTPWGADGAETEEIGEVGEVGGDLFEKLRWEISPVPCADHFDTSGVGFGRGEVVSFGILILRVADVSSSEFLWIASPEGTQKRDDRELLYREVESRWTEQNRSVSF